MAERMNISNRTVLIVLGLLVAAAVVIPKLTRSRFATSPIPADVSNFDAAVAQARTDGRPVYLEFTAEWCHYCRLMQDEVLSDPEVRSALKRVVYLPVDYDRQPQLVERFEVTGIPAGRLLKVEGDELKVIDLYEGAVDKSQFLRFLAAAGK